MKRTESWVTLSTKISDNVLINGKVGVPVGGVSETTAVGDFEVQVLLNEDRTLSLKFFNRENSIQNFGEQIDTPKDWEFYIEFDNLRELFKELFSKNNKKEDPQDKVNRQIFTQIIWNSKNKTVKLLNA